MLDDYQEPDEPTSEEIAEALYPEHLKLKAIAHLSQAQGEFVDWLQEQGIMLARYGDKSDVLWPDLTPIPTLLAKYHGIDQRELEAEKRAMLEECRKPRSATKIIF